MKLLSVVVPCYNSQDYMKYCIESLLPGGKYVEIIIVDDGSIDKTGEIADGYACAYPSIVKVIHQKNGGHGEAVNTGIKNASGMYFKVVDSDDWVDTRAYFKILEKLNDLVNQGKTVDMFISNYVYEKEGSKNKKIINYSNVLPEDRIFTWDETGKFHKGQYILMHSVIYRTGIFKECNLNLPKHTFYVDNLYVYIPLKYVKKMYYLNVDFYRYFIGREDQSVNEKVMIKRIDQQLKVNKMMIEYSNLQDIANEKLRNYMFNYLEIITIVSGILLIKSGISENISKKKDFWNYIRETDIYLYRHLRYGIMGQLINLPGVIGRKICIVIYKISQRIVGFN